MSLNSILANAKGCDSDLDQLSGLCVTEWCILIAMKRCLDKHPDETVNFDLLFEEYSNGFTASARTNDAAALARKFSRTVLRAAADMLVAKGIISVGKIAERGRCDTVNTREDISVRIPLGRLPEWLQRESSCPDVLKKLATEVL